MFLEVFNQGNVLLELLLAINVIIVNRHTHRINKYLTAEVFACSQKTMPSPFSQPSVAIPSATTVVASCSMSTNHASSTSRKCVFRKRRPSFPEGAFPGGEWSSSSTFCSAPFLQAFPWHSLAAFLKQQPSGTSPM